MARNTLWISAIFAFGSVLFCLGCQESPKADNTKSASAKSEDKLDHKKSAPETVEMQMESPVIKSAGKEKQNGSQKEEKPVSKRSRAKTPPPPPTIPNVGLTDKLLATCLVKVGDVMPDGELLTAEGGKVSLESQFGEKYTVLFIWSEGESNYARLAADSALSDLQNDIAGPYAGKGIKVIGINEGDRPQSVQQELQKIGVKVPCFFDPDGTYFAKVARSILPRIYLLDASGKIIWFDTEYTQSTRRNLMLAVKVIMGEK
jgi:hypothetical protein